MSRTDVHIPYWVAGARYGEVDHDHRNGRCVIEEPSTRSSYFRHRSIEHDCPRKTVTIVPCPGVSVTYSYEDIRNGFAPTESRTYGRGGCRRAYERLVAEVASINPVRNVSRAERLASRIASKPETYTCSVDHTQVAYDRRVECSTCTEAQLSRPTCDRSVPWSEASRYGGRGSSSWRGYEEAHRRTTTRTSLRVALREYNADGDTETEVDTTSPRAGYWD